MCLGGVIAVAVGVLQPCGPRRESHLEDVKERNKESLYFILRLCCSMSL